jgi:hypothetical protein
MHLFFGSGFTIVRFLVLEKGPVCRTSFSEGCRHWSYFGGKVSKDTVSDESMYLIYSSSLKENRDAVGGFGSYSPVFMGIHCGNDPQHHTYCVTANGSSRSIYEWSERPCQAIDENTPPIFDKDQKRAFQVIVAHFVVTYYRDAEFNFINRTGRQEYLNNRKNLEKMINGKKRLLVFFSGVGGSEKTAVINQIMMYASEFCRNLGSINRETLATSASHIMKTMTNLMEKSTEVNGQIHDYYTNHRRNIIFVRNRTRNLANLNRVLKKLRENYVEMYGGINIVFCGAFRQ